MDQDNTLPLNSWQVKTSRNFDQAKKWWAGALVILDLANESETFECCTVNLVTLGLQRCLDYDEPR